MLAQCALPHLELFLPDMPANSVLPLGPIRPERRHIAEQKAEERAEWQKEGKRAPGQQPSRSLDLATSKNDPNLFIEVRSQLADKRWRGHHHKERRHLSHTNSLYHSLTTQLAPTLRTSEPGQGRAAGVLRRRELEPAKGAQPGTENCWSADNGCPRRILLGCRMLCQQDTMC